MDREANYFSIPASVASATARASVILEPSVIEGECGSIIIDKVSAPDRVRLICRSGKTIEIEVEPRNDMTYEIAAFRDMVLGKLDHKPYLLDTARVAGVIDRVHTLTGAWLRMSRIPEKA